MKKIAIIGSPGAGKTTFAKTWSRVLRIKVYHLDRIFWKRGWEPIDRETRIDILQNVVQEKQWIIEGTYISSSEPRLEAADTIIFLDASPFVCLLHTIKRHREYHGLSRRDIPEGCTDRLTPLRMLKLLSFPLHGRRRLEDKLRKFPPEKVIRLRSAKEIHRFLMHIEVSSPSLVKATHLASARR